MDLLVDKNIGRYHIIKKIGEGGMATVYKAFDNLLDREIAIKIIHNNLIQPALQEKMQLRFEREAKALAQLDHPNIVRINDFGTYEEITYITMPLIQGGTLKQYLGQKWDGKLAARFLSPIARALAYAHQNKIIHRDVKPANILISNFGQPMLSDFGIAKIIDVEGMQNITGTNIGMGTPDYMSPEQGLGNVIDFRTDIYSLGIILYELVTGDKPFIADTPLAVALKHVNAPLPNPRDKVKGLDRQLEKIIFKALAKNANQRFKTMEEMAQALEKVGGGGWQNSDVPLLPQKMEKSSGNITFDEAYKKPHFEKRRNLKSKWWIIAAVGLIVLTVSSLFWINNRNSFPLLSTTSKTDINEIAVKITSSPMPLSTSTSAPTLTKIPSTPTIILNFPYLIGTPLPVLNEINSDNVANIIELARLSNGRLTDIATSPDNKTIAVAYSTEVEIIDKETLGPIQNIPIGDIDRIAFSSDSKSVFIEKMGEFSIWDLTKGEKIKSAMGEFMLPQRDGSIIIMKMVNDDTYKLLNPLNQSEIQTITLNTPSKSVYYHAMAFNNKYFTYTINGKTLEVIDVESGKVISRLGGYAGFSTVDLSPNDPYLASADRYVSDGNIKVVVWNVINGQPLLIFTPSLAKGNSQMYEGVIQVQFSQDGKNLAAALSDGTIHIWDIVSGLEEKVINVTGNPSGISSFTFSSQGTELVTGAYDGTIKIYGFPDGNELTRTNGIASEFRAISFSPNGKTIAAGTIDNEIILWDLSSGIIQNRISASSIQNGGGKFGISSIAFSSDGQTLAIANGSLVELWDVLSGKAIRTMQGHTGTVEGVVFCGVNNELVSGGDKTIRFWDTGSGKVTKTYTRKNNGISEIVCSSDGEFLTFIGTNPGTAPANLVINMFNSWQEAYVFTIPKYGSPVNGYHSALAFSPTNDLIAVETSKGIQIWNVKTGQEIDGPKFEKGNFIHSSASFSTDGKLLIYLNENGEISVWDIEKKKFIRTLNSNAPGINTLAFSPDNKLFASASDDGTVRIWGLAP